MNGPSQLGLAGHQGKGIASAQIAKSALNGAGEAWRHLHPRAAANGFAKTLRAMKMPVIGTPGNRRESTV